jgi:hypothetical protein
MGTKGLYMAILNGDTIYRIQVKHSGKVLAVGASSLDDVNIIQWDWQNGNEQRFRVFDLGADVYMFQALHSGKVMDVYQARTDNGANVIQALINGGTNQQFHVLPAGDSSGNYFFISPIHSNKNLGISASRQDNGAELIQWDNDGGDEQKFLFLATWE